MWIGNPDERKNPEREALLKQREKLVSKVTALKNSPPPAGSPSFKFKFYQEDLLKLAKEILNVDKKLGRK